MKKLVLLLFACSTASAAGHPALQKLFDSFKKPPVVTPQPAPHPPNLPVKK